MAQKRYFRSRREKVYLTIKFSIFKLAQAANLILNTQTWFFGPNLPKKGIWLQNRTVNTTIKLSVFELV